MSLIDECMTRCTMLLAHSEPDGEGGQKVIWKDGDSFLAAFKVDSQVATVSADKAVQQVGCIVTTKLPKLLRFGEAFRREEDGAVFRVISDSANAKTPARATFQIAQCKAERWCLE